MNIMAYIESMQVAAETMPGDIKKLCEEAIRFHYRGIIVNSMYTSYAKSLITSQPIELIATVGYPLGAMALTAKAEECAYAISHGADSIEMVIAVGRAKCGEWDYVTEDMRRVVKNAAGHPVCAVVETGLLNAYETARVCRMAANAGISAVRTSTQFSQTVPQVDDVLLLSKASEGKLAVKVGGKVDDYELAKQLIDVGAICLSTIAGKQLVRAAVAEAEAAGLYKGWDETNPFENMTEQELFYYLQQQQAEEKKS
ncbi:deoxyribose-phosphate aldolase [Veillonellaceae bacterium M2-8]|nr:deoxyribose-phosphate aldolase [Veillonellaceae bacterium M2-8]